jgi:hypothetical protein
MKFTAILSLLASSAITFAASAGVDNIKTTDNDVDMPEALVNQPSEGRSLRALPPHIQDAKKKVNSWWKWNLFFKAPRTETAFTTETCIEHYQDQPVTNYFFLAGYDNQVCGTTPFSRTCQTVSSSDTLLIPVVNLLCDNRNKGTGYSNKAYCNSLIGRYETKDLYAKYDGKVYPIYRIESPAEFTAYGHGSTKYFTDGYWVVVPHPTKGTHTVEVGVTDYHVLEDKFGEVCPNAKYTLYVK